MPLQQILYSQTAEGMTALDPEKTRGHSLGVIRSAHVESKYDIETLLSAAKAHAYFDMPNPNVSAGCSPLLRALLVQFGVAHSIVNEISSDSQLYGHQGGNAIDVAGGSATNQLSDIRAIADFAKLFAPMFSLACYFDPFDSTRSVYVWDGAITTVSTVQLHVGASFPQECSNKVHFASSFGRINIVLSTNTTIQHLFSTSTETTATITGSDRLVNDLTPDESVAVFQSSQKINTRW